MARIVTSDYKLVQDGVVELLSPSTSGSGFSAEMSVDVGDTVVNEVRPAVLMWRMHVQGGQGLEYRVAWKRPGDQDELRLWSTSDGGMNGDVMVSLQEVVDAWPIEARLPLRFSRMGAGGGRLFISDVVLFYGRLASI